MELKPITKLYLKAFLFTGLPFALLMLLFEWGKGNGISWWTFLFMLVFFGGSMSLILVSLHQYRIKKNGEKELTKDSLGASQSKKMYSSLGLSQLLEQVKAHPTLGKMKITRTEDKILIRTGASWKSWGEKIKIEKIADDDAKIEYRVSSRAILKTTLVDYGKNLENIRLLEELISN